MAVTYTYDSEENLVYVHPGKILTTKDIHKYFIALLEDDRLTPDFIEVVYFSEVETFDSGADDSSRLKPTMEQVKKKKGYKAGVLITESPLQFGMARLFSTSLEGILDLFVVRAENEAKELLEKLRNA